MEIIRGAVNHIKRALSSEDELRMEMDASLKSMVEAVTTGTVEAMDEADRNLRELSTRTGVNFIYFRDPVRDELAQLPFSEIERRLGIKKGEK